MFKFHCSKDGMLQIILHFIFSKLNEVSGYSVGSPNLMQQQNGKHTFYKTFLPPPSGFKYYKKISRIFIYKCNILLERQKNDSQPPRLQLNPEDKRILTTSPQTSVKLTFGFRSPQEPVNTLRDPVAQSLANWYLASAQVKLYVAL